ncbi:MAG: hypothetical protein MJ247_01270 [Alphaproteobacteria bacterium]|nr:hypothetical protein [Alphaproteobacteria bacterium]
MEKTEKNTIEETKDNEIVELKDDDMSTITAGSGKHCSGSHNNGCDKNIQDKFWIFHLGLEPHDDGGGKIPQGLDI